jgi:hypothetical protein
MLPRLRWFGGVGSVMNLFLGKFRHNLDKKGKNLIFSDFPTNSFAIGIALHRFNLTQPFPSFATLSFGSPERQGRRKNRMLAKFPDFLGKNFSLR